MNNKNFKMLIKEWKNFLNESEEDKPVSIEKIYKQINKLEEINFNSNLEYKIKIQKENINKYNIGYVSKEKSMFSNVNLYLNSKEKKQHELAPQLYGCIEIMSSKAKLASEYDNPDVEAPGKAKDEVNSTWYITKTHDTKKGMGPLLYEVVIEFVSNKLNAGIKPDAALVSGEAIKVWENYFKRNDVVAKQLDINPDDISYYKKEYPDQWEDQGVRKLMPLTPQTSDDTSQFSAMDHMGYMWPESPLSKTYRKYNNEIIMLLKEKELITLDI